LHYDALPLLQNQMVVRLVGDRRLGPVVSVQRPALYRSRPECRLAGIAPNRFVLRVVFHAGASVVLWHRVNHPAALSPILVVLEYGGLIGHEMSNDGMAGLPAQGRHGA
jgi:hypothetical protein